MNTTWIFKILAIIAVITVSTGCAKKVPQTNPGDEGSVDKLSLSRVTPAEGLDDEEVTITIHGKGLKAGAVVRLGQTTLVSPKVTGSSSLAAVVPRGLNIGVHDLSVENPDGQKSALTGAFSVRSGAQARAGANACPVQAVRFAFDSAELSEPSRAMLEANVTCLKKRGAAAVQIQGHADERGSTEYNLALGQRRADAVRTYMTRLGFANITSISFGEERPIAREQNEAAWASNRRAETDLGQAGMALR